MGISKNAKRKYIAFPSEMSWLNNDLQPKITFNCFSDGYHAYPKIMLMQSRKY
jgi:hypothetical protein